MYLPNSRRVQLLSTADLLYSLLNMNALTERSPRRRRHVRQHRSTYHYIKSKCYKVQNIIIISILIWIIVSIYFVGSIRGGINIDGIGIRQHLRGVNSNRQYDNVWIHPDSQPFVSFILQFTSYRLLVHLSSYFKLS